MSGLRATQQILAAALRLVGRGAALGAQKVSVPVTRGAGTLGQSGRVRAPSARGCAEVATGHGARWGPGRGRSPRTRPAGPVTVGRGRTASGLGGRGSAGRATAGFAPWGQGAGRRGTCHGRGRVTADDSGLQLEPWRARRLRLPGRRKAERGRHKDRSSRLDRGKPLRSQESGKQVPARTSLSQRDRPRLPRRLGAAPRLRP